MSAAACERKNSALMDVEEYFTMKHMKNSKQHLYMKMDKFKKTAGGRTGPKARTLGVLAKIAILFVSGRFVLGLVLIIAAMAWANENIVQPGLEPRCWFSMAGNTATAKGVVTNIEFVSLGPKNRDTFKVHYTFAVGGKTYAGASFQEGLIFRKNEAIDVSYSVQDPSCSCGGGLKCPAEDAMYTIIFGGMLLVFAIFLVQSGVRRIARTIAVIEYGTLGVATVRSIARSTRRTGTLSHTVFIHKWVASCGFPDSSGKNTRLDVISSSENFLKKGDQLEVVFDPGMPANALAIDALPFFVKTTPVLRAR
jgi:hypothetical protein